MGYLRKFSLTLLAAVGFCSILAAQANQTQLTKEAKITTAEAERIALAKVRKGNVKSAEIEREKGHFSTDLSNDGIKSDPGLMKFCARLAPGISFLKGASYLLHENGFSFVRDFLLQHSKLILQDDSGIPYRCFNNETWNVRFCGNYVGPIEIFKKYAQPDLAEDYAKSAPAPLSFGFGYEWQPSRSSLTIAVRK